MNPTPPPLPPSTSATAGHAKGRPWLALIFLAIGIAPALLCLSLIYTTHYKSSSVDVLLVKFFIADAVCALISGVGIGLTAGRQWWLRLLIALPVARAVVDQRAGGIVRGMPADNVRPVESERGCSFNLKPTAG